MWPPILPLGLKENKERERGRKWKDWREVEDVELIFCTTDLTDIQLFKKERFFSSCQ